MQRKEIPILFSTLMVQALLDGRKTQTRRVMKKQPSTEAMEVVPNTSWKGKDFCARRPLIASPGHEILNLYRCPYGQPGDVLWVRESWNLAFPSETIVGEVLGPEADHYSIEAGESVKRRAVYKASFAANDPEIGSLRWKPSIHMPKWASRIWLRVESVRVERLQDISYDDAVREGMDSRIAEAQEMVGHITPKTIFMSLWQDLHGVQSWDENPWLWVVSFKVLSTTGREAAMQALEGATV